MSHVHLGHPKLLEEPHLQIDSEQEVEEAHHQKRVHGLVKLADRDLGSLMQRLGRVIPVHRGV